MTHVERVLRDTFQAKEHLVAGRPGGLAPAVRRRVARRRRVTWLAVGGVTTAVLVGAGVLAGGGRPGLPAAAPASPSPPATPAAAWRVESSLGVQIEVPGHWTVNDYGCGMSAAPSVVRGQGAVRLCLTGEVPTKEVAVIQLTVPDHQAGLAERSVTVDGVPGTRAEGRWPDGRAAGWIWLPSRQVGVVVRTLDRGTTNHILDSLDLVDVDLNGCASRRPPLPAAPPGRTGPLLPERPDGIAICNYSNAGGDRLHSSTRLTGEPATALAAAVNTARPGANPDLPGDKCAQSTPPEPDLLLLAGDARVWVTFSSCTGRGMTDGTRHAQITQPLVGMMMKPLHAGYGYPE